jgi:AcrR family transcriptional regulator
VTSPARRERLSRERIVQAALEIADDQGLDALSLRGVAARLGVTPMPLYRHVANGDELVDLVVEALLEREGRPEELPLEWDALLETIAWRTRTTLLRHPAVYDALRRRALTTTSAMHGMEALLESFDRAGLSASDAVSAYAAVLMPVLGNVALVHGRSATLAAEDRSEREERARVTDQLLGLDASEYPLLTQHGSEFARLLDDDVFAWGLEVVLDGLRARFGSRGRRRR